MIGYSDLMEHHKRRIHRPGKALWESLKSMHGETISVEMAKKIKDQYGLRPTDLIFILQMKDVTFDVDEFTRIINEEMEATMSLRQCDNGAHA